MKLLGTKSECVSFLSASFPIETHKPWWSKKVTLNNDCYDRMDTKAEFC